MIGRNCIYGVSLAALAFAAPAGAEEIAAASRVISATVYPASATVRRAARFDAPAGRHEIAISDLPIGLDAGSLRVEGEGAFQILGLDHHIDRPGLEPLSDIAREALLDRIRGLEWDLRSQRARQDAAQARIDYMEEFRRATLVAGGRGEESAGLISIAEGWSDAWALMSTEVAAAQEAELAAARRVDFLERELDKARRELDRAGPPPPARGVVTVSISADQPINGGRLAIAYLTPEASWAPLYDLRLEKVAASGGEQADGEAEAAEEIGAGARRLRLVRRAAIRQSTGEDWIAARLELSTARPSGRLGARKPQIRQAMFAPDQPQPAYSEAPRMELDDEAGAGYSRNVLMAQRALSDAPEEAPAPAVESSALAAYDGAVVVYEIREPVRLPGDGAVRQALIGEESSIVATVVRATPSLDPSAYLYAAYENGAAPLLPGAAALYRDGAYFGQLDLEYVAPGDTSALPFGPLETVVVTRQVRGRAQGEEGIFRSSNRERSRFAMTAKNLGEDPLTVTLFDSLPYTETEEIGISLVGRDEPTERDVDGRRGALAWTFQLEPKASKEIEFGYDISWPEGKKLELFDR